MSKTKISLILMLAGTATFFAGLGLYSTMDTLTSFEIGTAVFVVLLTIGGLVIARGKLKDEKRGLPPDDEMSKSIRDRAGAVSFLVSFYLWSFIIVFFSNSELDFEVIVGSGLGVMALIFFGLWIYYSKTGIGNEEQN